LSVKIGSVEKRGKLSSNCC